MDDSREASIPGMEQLQRESKAEPKEIKYTYHDGQGRLWITIAGDTEAAKRNLAWELYADAGLRTFKRHGKSKEEQQAAAEATKIKFDQQFSDLVARKVAGNYIIFPATELRLAIVGRYINGGNLKIQLTQNLLGDIIDPNNPNYNDRITQLKDQLS